MDTFHNEPKTKAKEETKNEHQTKHNKKNTNQKIMAVLAYI